MNPTVADPVAPFCRSRGSAAWQRVKIVAVITIVIFNVIFWIPVIRGNPPHAAPFRHGAPSAVESITEVIPKLRAIMFLIWPICAIILATDAVLRRYEGPRGRALGLAIGGIISLGLSSILYFLIWGYHPLRRGNQAYGSEFCVACLADSKNSGAPSTGLIKGIAGVVLVGQGKFCESCGSRIKTLWAWVVIPLLPCGSFRVIPTSQEAYISRRVRLNWGQVLATYALWWAIGVPVLIWIIYGEWNGH